MNRLFWILIGLRLWLCVMALICALNSLSAIGKPGFVILGALGLTFVIIAELIGEWMEDVTLLY